MAIPISKPSTNTKWPQNKKQFERIFINDTIKANIIVVVDENWENLWTHKRDYALAMAEEKWLDLVQMSYDFNKNTAICKIVDRWKYQYQKKKDENTKRKTANKWMKEIDFGYNIWENDLQLKIKKWKDLLAEWYNMRFVIKLKGRENIYKDKAKEKMQTVVLWLADAGKTQWIKEEARGFSAMFNPKK